MDRPNEPRSGDEREIERDPDRESIPATFERGVEEGFQRSTRTVSALLATGLVGGLDVGVGVLALLVVREATGNALLGALAFPIGFVALTLGSSELFTENFFVPVASLVAARIDSYHLGRLWLGTLVANLLGGWLVAALVIGALPDLGPVAVEVSHDYLDSGIGWQSFAGALLGGMVITLLTWLQHSTRSAPARLLAAYSVAFVLVAPPLSHSIVGSIEQFVALVHGADFGYADWLGFVAWAALGNLLGGVGLVTTLRLIQVGRPELERERSRS